MAHLRDCELCAYPVRPVFTRNTAPIFSSGMDLPGIQPSPRATYKQSLEITSIAHSLGFQSPPSWRGLSCSRTIALVLVETKCEDKRRSTFMAVVLAGTAAVLAHSGTVLVGLPTLAVLLIRRSPVTRTRVGLMVLSTIVSVWRIDALFATRSGVLDFSWADRLASIKVMADVQNSHIATILFGLGKGATTTLFTLHPTVASYSGQVLAGVSGNLSRMIIEQGYVVGGVVIAMVVGTFWKSCEVMVGRTCSWLISITWLTLGLLALAYETTSWLWTLPGIAAGLSTRPSRPTIGELGIGADARNPSTPILSPAAQAAATS